MSTKLSMIKKNIYIIASFRVKRLPPFSFEAAAHFQVFLITIDEKNQKTWQLPG